MSPAMGVLIAPFTAAIVLAFLPGWRLSAWLNVAAAFAAFVSAVAIAVFGAGTSGSLLAADALNTTFLILNTFVGFTTALFSRSYIIHEIAAGRLKARHMRYYHALYQVLLGAMNLALLTSVSGLMWVAIEIATLSTVLIVGLYRTHAALEAAWKYFILGSVGIALALFGTILVYSAAQPVIGDGLPAMTFSQMQAHAAALDPALLDVAFVFILLGYGTKAGLVPLHAWLPDAHAEGPTPISAVLSGLLLNVAMYAILRFKLVMAANPGALDAGPLLIGAGLVSVIFAALMLYKRRDIKRFFAYSSVEHMGVAAFAFGIGGPLASFAGLLHMAMHSLTKSAIFFTVGQIAHVKGSQKIADITGLTSSHPTLGWLFVMGAAAIAGLPPFGLFTSEFLILTACAAQHPILTALLGLGLLTALGALFLRINTVAFGVPEGRQEKSPMPVFPILLHFALVLAAGLFLPVAVVNWLQQVALSLG